MVAVLDIAVAVAALTQMVAVHVAEVYERQRPFLLVLIPVLLAFHAMYNGQNLHRNIFRGLAGREPEMEVKKILIFKL